MVGGRKGHMCAKISEGCVHCYSEAINHMFGNQADYSAANCKTATHYLDDKALAHFLTFRPKGPYKGGARPKVFPFDMTDLFGDWVSDEMILTVLVHFALRSDVDWLVLTKRADRLRRSMNDAMERLEGAVLRWHASQSFNDYALSNKLPVHPLKVAERIRHREWWPLPNLWIGVSAENQKRADERIPLLLKTPAAVRFVSYEPALGPVDFSSFLHCGYSRSDQQINGDHGLCRESGSGSRTGIDWALVGGEIGPKARPCSVDWIRSAVRQFAAAEVPLFVKQLGTKPVFDDYEASVEWPDGVYFDSSEDNEPDCPNIVILKDPKGGDPAEWPEDLRVRQFPPRVEAAK